MKFVTRRDLWLSITIWVCILISVFSGLSPFFISGIDAGGGTIVFIIQSITSVKPVTSIVASAATSSKRLEIPLQQV